MRKRFFFHIVQRTSKILAINKDEVIKEIRTHTNVRQISVTSEKVHNINLY